MRPGPSAPVSSSDIQESDVAGVLLDEGPPRLHLIAHQLREDLVGERRVLDVDPDQHPLRRIHRRLAELVRVHLAETLEAADLDAFLREVESNRPQLLEGLRRAHLLPRHNTKRGSSYGADEPRVHLPQVSVERRREERGRNGDERRRARLALHHLRLEHLRVVLDDGDVVAVRLQRRESRLDLRRLADLELDEPVRDDEVRGRVAEVGAKLLQKTVELGQLSHEAVVLRLGKRKLGTARVRHHHVLHPLAHEQALELRLLLDVELAAAELHPVERRDGDVDVTALDELGHVPVQEGQDQRADVRAVDVGVRHHDHAVVAQLRDVELVEDAGADRGDHRLDLRVREHLVDSVLLRVDDLAAQREDRLVRPVARVLRGTAGRVALDEVELRRFGVANLTVGELAGKRRALERALAARELPRLARRLPRTRGRDGLLDDLPRVGRVLLEELREALVHRLLHEPTDSRVPELRLRLALELRLAELHRDNRPENLPPV